MELKLALNPENLSRRQKIILAAAVIATGETILRKSKWLDDKQYSAMFFEASKKALADMVHLSHRLSGELLYNEDGEVVDVKPTRGQKLTKTLMREYERVFLQTSWIDSSADQSGEPGEGR